MKEYGFNEKENENFKEGETNMIFICSECGRKIDPNVVHWEDGVPLPDGIGCHLKDPKDAMYNLCYDCICKLGSGKKLKASIFKHK